MNGNVELGLGLISIGRPWGFVKAPLPSQADVNRLLDEALNLGIRYFDTAPSYGLSEQRLGTFIHSLAPSRMREITIATKFGEHWDEPSDRVYVDHSYDELARSLDTSIDRLGKIDLLQVHKADVQVLRDSGVRRALRHATSIGIKHFGASVKDLESAELALRDELYSFVQFPLNLNNMTLERAFPIANETGKRILINRPFGMGELLYSGDTLVPGSNRLMLAYKAILRFSFSGAILMGTRSIEHLRENVGAFHRVTQGANSGRPFSIAG